MSKDKWYVMKPPKKTVWADTVDGKVINAYWMFFTTLHDLKEPWDESKIIVLTDKPTACARHIVARCNAEGLTPLEDFDNSTIIMEKQ